jgi:beta-galactosidase/beta-glucuronidase
MARGANIIPMDQLEGRLDNEAHRIAVRSAAAANTNMLRGWGGGMVLPEGLYDARDEEGVLLHHDMMFVEEAGHGPIRSEVVAMDIRHLVRPLSDHASIVL